jgi:hypothetical protein
MEPEAQHSWCEACGDAPWSVYDLREMRVGYHAEHITLCEQCRRELRSYRPAGVSVPALLEELYEHRLRAPKRNVTLAHVAGDRSLSRGRRR